MSIVRQPRPKTAVYIGPKRVGANSPTRIICVVGGADALQKASLAKRQGADILEARLDMWDEPSKAIADLRTLRRGHLPIIATVRRAQEGGFWGENEEIDRKNLLKQIIEEGLAHCVDIELNAKIRAAVLDLCREHEVTTIVSYHNFAGTPTSAKLTRIINHIHQTNADIIKVAVMADSRTDVHRMIRLTEKHVRELKPMVMISMGELGRPTRVLAGLFGSCMTYGFCGGKSMAPGQVSVAELKKALQTLPRQVSGEVRFSDLAAVL